MANWSAFRLLNCFLFFHIFCSGWLVGYFGRWLCVLKIAHDDKWSLVRCIGVNGPRMCGGHRMIRICNFWSSVATVIGLQPPVTAIIFPSHIQFLLPFLLYRFCMRVGCMSWTRGHSPHSYYYCNAFNLFVVVRDTDQDKGQVFFWLSLATVFFSAVVAGLFRCFGW